MHSTDASKKFQLLETSKLEFNKKCRRISIKNIPCGVVTQDILELLKPYYYQQIHVDKNSQSCKAVLFDGNCAARCIDDLNEKPYRGQCLSVSLASCDFMLCITQLPLSYTSDQFLSLITPFGTPERCFLVLSESSGDSKGYGCVEFTGKESSIKAKNQLNGFKIDGNTLQVHWLDSIPSDYSGLSSLCLLVENFPPAFNDNYMLLKLFSSLETPKFCQLANCSSDEFAIIEYPDAMQCEKTWKKMNKHNIGNYPLKVSFCVPGPCGLVVLNALKASRDLQRANPTGGLLPTPVHLFDQSNQSFNIGFNLMQHKKDMPATSLLPLERNNVPQDIKPHLVVNTVSTRTMENGLHQTSSMQSTKPNSSNLHWNQPPSISNGRSCNFPKQQGQSLWLDASTKQQFLNHHASHMLALRNRSGSMSSCDSSAKVEDDVFEPMRRSSHEEQKQQQFTSLNVNPEKLDENMHSFPQTFDIRNPTRSQSDAIHRLVPNLSNPVLFLREDSQRSESADSAYGGSQGSNSSDLSLPCNSQSRDRCTNQVMHSTHQSGTSHNNSNNFPSTGKSLHQIGIQSCMPTFPQSYLRQQRDHLSIRDCYHLPSAHGNGLNSEINGITPTSSGRFSPYRIPFSSTKDVSSTTSYEKMASYPHNVPSAFSIYSQEMKHDGSGFRLPKPHFHGFESLASKGFENHCNIQKTWNSRRTPVNAIKQHLEADSPTQLQLLGNNLIEGMLGDSPRSASDSESELGSSNSSVTRRLVCALNLFSPIESVTLPQTPSVLRREMGHVLPSPEPSPEAGAYVGQHSQGLGGHYADSHGLGSILSGISNLSQSPFSAPLFYKRRRSNET